MTRYLHPENMAFAYCAYGEILTLSPGDFFKCSHCRRFQRFEGRLYLLEQRGELLLLGCEACRVQGVPCRIWLPQHSKSS